MRRRKRFNSLLHNNFLLTEVVFFISIILIITSIIQNFEKKTTVIEATKITRTAQKIEVVETTPKFAVEEISIEPIELSKESATKEATMPEEVLVPKEPIVESKTEVKDLYLQSSAKTYMDYRAITNTDSHQYKLIHSDKIEICSDGFLRDKEGHIGVALGSYFGPIGTKYICHLDNGKTIPVIKVEAKSDAHTIDGFCGSANYDIIEFVIDTEAEWMQNNIYSNGFIFCGNFNNYEGFEGTVVKMEKV